MDYNRYTHEGWTADLHWSAHVPETLYAGGKPSRGTPADKRLKENRGMPPRMPAPMPKPSKPGGGKPPKGR